MLRARTDLQILLQGEEALPLLVRGSGRSATSCLLGVMSLWQGVDVPGDACQLVVIDRLPFPRPDEPLAAARSAAVDAAGGSGFAAVSVPIAAVRLAQGVGRLIRSTADRGVVAVLDSRLETARGYGAVPAPLAAAVLVHDQARGGPTAPCDASAAPDARAGRPEIALRRAERLARPVRPTWPGSGGPVGPAARARAAGTSAPADRGQVADRGVQHRDERHRDQRADDAGQHHAGGDRR